MLAGNSLWSLLHINHKGHTCNPSTLESEAGGIPQVRGHSDLHRELQANQGYIEDIFVAVQTACKTFKDKPKLEDNL